MNWPKIYLASQSPRRRELLQQIGVDFEVLPVEVDESPKQAEAPIDYVRRIALLKSEAGQRAIRQAQSDHRPIIAADTAVVTTTGEILGKPLDDTDARRMLNELSGLEHEVLTAVALAQENNSEVIVQHNRVYFDVLTAADIDMLVNSGEARDKAGSYGIQGTAAAFIRHIKGSYSGIMGLPLFETAQLLRKVVSA